MRTILIVDDQRVEREGIKFLIEKNRLPLNTVEKEDGEEALEYLKHHPVDILLTDIKMPIYDGLELSSKIREMGLDMPIILFSAHGDFHYAKKAIDYKVKHYLLKPIDFDEFLTVMNHAIEDCGKREADQLAIERLAETSQKMHRYEKEKLLMDMLLGTAPNESLSRRAFETGLSEDLIESVIILVEFKTKLFERDSLAFEHVVRQAASGGSPLHLNLNEFQSVVFCKGVDPNELAVFGAELKSRLSERFPDPFCMVFGPAIKDLTEVHAIYGRMEKLLENHLFFGDYTVLYLGQSAGPIEPGEVNGLFSKVSGHVRLNRMAEMREDLERLFHSIAASADIEPAYVKLWAAELAMQILQKQPHMKASAMYKTAEKIFKTHHMSDLRELLTALSQDQITNGDDRGHIHSSNIMDHVLQIIREEYANDIGLDYLAEKVYFSPGYLSFLFKKETGQTLIKYLTAYRLKMGEELLLNTTMKIIDIGKKTGYPNLSYFCNIFKNYYGVTPAQYRERGGNVEASSS